MRRLARWQYGLVVSFVVLMIAPLATAQDAEQTGTPEAEQTQQPLALEELRVVGSRSHLVVPRRIRPCRWTSLTATTSRIMASAT